MQSADPLLHLDQGNGRVYFDAILRPHRSLPPAGFYVLMGLVGGVSLTMGIMFLIIGAWPVFGFLGLDVLFLFWAFRMNYRDGLAFEEVTVAERGVIIERVSPYGRVRRQVLTSPWLTVRLEEDAEGQPGALELMAHGKPCEIGRFLPPAERRDLADALRLALDERRSGGVE